MKKELLTNLGMRALNNSECAMISGGAGIDEHMSCIRRAYRNGPWKTLFLGATVWGIARTIGIVVGCTGA